jgi:dipeptidyl aminopeptidase/acylaminoacyl peptidase
MQRRSILIPLCIAFVAAVFALCCVKGMGQSERQYTAQDYAQAERFMWYNVLPLANQGVVHARWLDDGRFWYRDANESGVTYLLVDPGKGTRNAAFDHARLAAALNTASGAKIKDDARHLKIDEFSLSDRDTVLTLHYSDGVSYHCAGAPNEYHCERRSPGPQTQKPQGNEKELPTLALSPNGKLGAFIRDWNLWVVDLATGTEIQLTTDGVKDYGYATDNAGWRQSDAAILLWSPDSTRIATFQQDQRKTGEMYLVPVTNTHPALKAWKYPLVGDENVTMIERVVIDVNARKIVRLKMPPDQHRSTLCDDLICDIGGTWEDVEWNQDGSHVAFVSTSRDHKQEWLRVADVSTGEVRDVMGETVKTFYESGDGKRNWHYLPDSNEILWFSERDNWGNLYLYDLATGKLKNQITHGEGNVSQVLHVDEKTRTIYFVGVGKEPGRDPYFRHFYSVHFDGTGLRLLTPENADHDITVSKDGRYFVDSYSTPQQPAKTVVRNSDGKTVMDVASQDISKLLAYGWVPPTSIRVKARDGKTDLYGMMYKPSHFDPSQKYPIVNYVYPGPQIGSCGDRGFRTSFGDLQSLAELGFIVVCIDGMGTPGRSKSFHEAYYGDMGDNTIPDQVAGMKDLATQFPFIDIDRVGIFGHSGGGNATVAAMFHFPDFFKVGFAESSNNDARDYEDDWAEKWAGLLVKKPDGTSNYDSQANQNTAGNLKGHLLLAHGTMDDNVPPSNTMLVVDALIKANKDFDLVLIPNATHFYGDAVPYMRRRRWDYFVRYLAGGFPPKEYQMTPFAKAIAAVSNGPSVEEGYGEDVGP